ncbi:MAG: L,D-transpeptidase [Chlamydiota bacterium]
MKFPRFLLLGTCSLFFFIIVLSFFQKKPEVKPQKDSLVEEIVLIDREVPLPPAPAPDLSKVAVKQEALLPEKDQIDRLFALDSSKLPIVETITYTSRVPWLEGRCAWISDYASHYKTSRHFIARSLRGSKDYSTQNVAPGDRLNVFAPDKNIEFHLLVDVSRSKMWFYYVDVDVQERVLLKTYPVGLGRKDPDSRSGCLTPLGSYQIGDKVAIYKPGIMGYFQEQKVEMIQIFGTRWMPFEKALSEDAENPKGYGIHGSPWTSAEGGSFVEDTTHIQKYDSDGCIRLASSDIEELFAIVITKPTFVHVVSDFHDADLPGSEQGE